MSFLQEGDVVITGSDRGEVHIFDVRTGKCAQTLRTGSGLTVALAVSIILTDEF